MVLIEFFLGLIFLAVLIALALRLIKDIATGKKINWTEELTSILILVILAATPIALLILLLLGAIG